MRHDVCSQAVEVTVCNHVAAGQAYDLLVMDSEDAFVETAFCEECASRISSLLKNNDPEQAALVALTFTTNICRECARDLNIPDVTPNGEHAWERPIQ